MTYSVKISDDKRYATDAEHRVLYQERVGTRHIINHLHSEMRYRWTTIEVVGYALNQNEAEYGVRCMARKAGAA